ncbi:FecR family protein [Chitinophaga sp. CB10]|uniref:FecR family protein n=1 Tax=Chitinophaga sp. CB10 TaxID=1891659 RepID=UPI000A50B46A|nr:FecR family protein [Chitinophaga sp. CB10]
MTKKELQELLDKHAANQQTAEESAKLQQWYEQLGNHAPAPDWDPHAPAYLQDRLREFNDLKNPPKRRYLRIIKISLATAAAIAALAVILYKPSIVTPPATNIHGPVAATTPAVPISEATAYDRHITLPDSSVVLLKAGSTLQMESDFEGNRRQVSLNGESYFEIKANPAKPFIIRTGNIRTQVLGTSFNIRTDKNGSMVSIAVTSGKVRVTNNNKELAVLTKNQVLNTHTPAQVPVKLENVANAQVAWISRELYFNDITLGAICQKLAERYQVKINIDPKVNSEKKVTITDAFAGTESLNEILDIICATLGYQYTVAAQTVTITL